MIETYDLARKKTAILQNALSVVETHKINGVWTLTFKLPAEDEKNAFCKARHLVNCDGNLYRIMSSARETKDNGRITYNCEHVIATLVDDVLYGHHVVGNIGTHTNEVIQYILDRQTTKNWVLGRCEFSRQFEYGWEQENLLAALFSVATPLASPYIWRYDTTTYPWKVHLDVLDTDARPQYYVIGGLNLVAGTKKEDATKVVTRLYCKGSGEGVNQTGIESVNNGVPYLQAPQENINKYGLVTSVWTDRRYENSESLMQAGQAMLNELMQPRVEYTLTAANVHAITGDDLHKAEVGRITLFRDEGYKTYITQVVRNHDKDNDIKITVANKPSDIATSLADLADRQRVESVYSQGATQLWGSPLQGNASPTEPLVYPLWIPEGTKQVNQVVLKVKLSRFRAYSQATEDAGRLTQTSSAGGGGTQTSSAGGGGTQTSSAGGGGTQTSSAGGGGTTTSGASTRNTTTVTGSGVWGAYGGDASKSGTTGQTKAAENAYHSHAISFPGSSHRHYMGNHSHGMDHTHSVSFGTHSHNVSFGTHSHNVSFGTHSHSVTFNAHTHSVDIPAHRHAITHGIFYDSTMPTGATISIGGEQKHIMGGTDFEGDITGWLVENGSIPRGRWINIEVKPNTNAYIVISPACQGFIQSYNGGKY